jgi:hypothetical protein
VARTTDDEGVVEILTINVIAAFEDYTAELDDGSKVFVKAHCVTVVVDPQKIQVADLLEKFNENIGLGSHQETKYTWWHFKINDFNYINSQHNLNVAMKKYGKRK